MMPTSRPIMLERMALGSSFSIVLPEGTIRFTEVQLRNALAARDAWLAENPNNKKMLLDVSFKKLIAEPKQTVKDIYSYFDMDFTSDVEAKLDATLADQNTQKKVKYVPLPSSSRSTRLTPARSSNSTTPTSLTSSYSSFTL